ncbi:hypothetical protein U91I_03019 [alpha proteobacterium U9-1i]|nr:hypothetical protein U91I_03019 [alpha proteobacterium U9-1i]
MKYLIVTAILALTCATPALADVRPNLSGFTKVDASAGMDVTVTVGSGFRVEVTGPGADRVMTRVSGDTLHVEPTPGMHWGRRPPSEIRVSMPTLTGLDASSGSDIHATGINGGDVTLETSSGADITAAGACRTLSAHASSGSDLDARGLRCESGSADVSSGADIILNVSGTLNVDASSGGGVTAIGDPRIGDISLSSGGSLRRSR